MFFYNQSYSQGAIDLKTSKLYIIRVDWQAYIVKRWCQKYNQELILSLESLPRA